MYSAENVAAKRQLFARDLHWTHSHHLRAAQRQKAVVAQKAQAKGKMSKPAAKDIDHREGKRKREDGALTGRQAPAKRKTKTPDDPPPRKKRAASSQVYIGRCSQLLKSVH